VDLFYTHAITTVNHHTSNNPRQSLEHILATAKHSRQNPLMGMMTPVNCFLQMSYSATLVVPTSNMQAHVRTQRSDHCGFFSLTEFSESIQLVQVHNILTLTIRLKSIHSFLSFPAHTCMSKLAITKTWSFPSSF